MVDQSVTSRILIVDDEPDLRNIFKRFLEIEGYPCRTAGDGEKALEMLGQEDFSLVISDINMPGISGIDLLRELGDRHPDVAVLMVSAIDDRKVAVQSLQLGAFSYMIKPVSRNELVINVVNGLRRRFLEIAHRRQSEKLEDLVQRRTRKLREAKQELVLASEETVLRLAKAAEFRDDETAQHTLRMSHYCRIIARGCGFDAKRCELIRLASQLHDVGKIGIPDAILLKPGKLTVDEFTLMKEHARFGFRILSDSRAELLQTGAVIARWHHEKFDGSGYPDGLVGEDIAIEARIAAIADVFDALTTRRVYKDALPVSGAIDILKKGRGHHFDPVLLDIFLADMDVVRRIRERFRDRGDQPGIKSRVPQ
ncbi:MAG: two-component system response regulator [Desulfobulbus sp.]|nr:MAG: two-component system response regulator [Desulfobulbus sp.]